MIAFGLSLALFVFWTALGYAILTVLRRRDLLQNMLLAPAVGIAVTLMPIFWLSRLGLPVRSFGALWLFALLLIIVGLLWRHRPTVPVRHYLPFAAIFLFALVLTGRPMFEFGFDWLSFSNDDMANYALRAHRLLNHSYTAVPNLGDLISGRDYSLVFWFMDVPGGSRTGADLVLAWVISWTGLNGHQIFMPVILAFHLVLISTAGALLCQSSRYRFAALVTCSLLSMSALMALGTIYQLIAQVLGLGLLCACAVVLFTPLSPPLFPPAEQRVTGLVRGSIVRHAILIAFVVSAFLVSYPEVAPFLGAAFILHVGLRIVPKRHTVNWRAALLGIGMVGLLSLAFLNMYVIDLFRYSINQADAISTVNTTGVLIFPYYLIPSGLADLWGLQSIDRLPAEPLLSYTILLGAGLLLASSISIVVLLRHGQTVAVFAAIMLSVGLFLFWRRSDFGLFKLAMYIQPFLLGSLVIFCLTLRGQRYRWLRVLPLLVLGVYGIRNQQHYVEASRGASLTFVEVPNASALKINTEFQKLLTATPAPAIIIDTANVVLVKFQALYTKGTSTAFISNPEVFNRLLSLYPVSKISFPDLARHISNSVEGPLLDKQFNLHSPNNPNAVNPFKVTGLGNDPAVDTDHTLIVLTCPQQSAFNRWRLRDICPDASFSAIPLKQARNYLVFIRSELGQHYYAFTTASNIALYQLEPDYFYSGQSMIGIGRYLLFEAINPSATVRIVLEMTKSIQGDGENKLPPAMVIGEERLPFGIAGRGSMRRYSPPIIPQKIDGHDYVLIDMGQEGQYYSEVRTGLMSLYGADVRRDPRPLVGYARDIALVTEEEYTQMQPPAALSVFPKDLANRTLEYSGIYEDGWLSEDVFLRLQQPKNARELVIRGTVPLIDAQEFVTDVVVLLDGQEVTQQTLKSGALEIRVPSPKGAGPRQVELRFSKMQRLSGGDSRPVTVSIRFIGFETNPRGHLENEQLR
jgi:hypothetical protein